MPERARGAQAVRDWLGPPVLGDDASMRRARRLWLLSAGTLGVVVPTLGVLTLIEPQTVWRRAVSLGAILALALASHLLNRAGRTRSACWLFLAGLVAIVTQRGWITGGIYSPVAPFYVVFVLMGGVLLGRNGGLVTALMAAGGATILAAGQVAGLLVPAREFGSPIGMVVFLAMILGLALLLQSMVAQSLRDSLEVAQREIVHREQVQQRLALALEAGQIGVWELDPATERLTADRRLLDIYGLEADADGTVAYATWFTRVHPDDRDAVRATVAGLRAGDRRARLEFRAVRTDGVERHVLSAGAALEGPGGTPPSLVGMNVDITERKVAELERLALVGELRERVKELRLLHEAAITQQRDWTTPDELLAHIVARLPSAWQHSESAVARITLGEYAASSDGWRPTPWMLRSPLTAIGRSGAIEVAYTREFPDAEHGPFLEEERALIASLAEMIAAILGSIQSRHDLEATVAARTKELAESLTRLQDAERLRDDLVQMIVHDMRGLLHVVLGNLELARLDASGPMLSDLDQASVAAKSLSRMANDLLDVSRLEGGTMPLAKQRCDVAAIAAGSATAMAALDATRPIECTASSPVLADCDPDLIRRVLDNLIGNAVKHTPDGGRIRVMVSAADARLRVSVIDEGDGVPEDARERIFQKFGSTTRGRKFHSAGLGLAFCRLAIEAHGGTIGVTAAQPRGSAFAFEIPAVA